MIAQIEHVDAVNCIEEILKVEGLDAVFIGPHDLSGSMGMLGQTGHPDVVAAIDRVLAAGKAAGVPVGIASSDSPDDNVALVKAGFRMLGMAVDFVFLSKTGDRLVNGVKAGLAAQ